MPNIPSRAALSLGVLGLILAMQRPANGIVWSDDNSPASTEQSGVLKHAGCLYFTRLEVFGGCCVWIGDRWVLTARHCIEGWSVGAVRVSFPAHNAERYRVKAFHTPADRKMDIALIELDRPLNLKAPPILQPCILKPGDPIRLGGYGTNGLVSGPKRLGKFHWGTNVLTAANENKASFRLDKVTEQDAREAIPALLDSGSPVFQVVDADELLLVGVSVSVSDAANPEIGDRANLSCVAGQADWIRKLAPQVHWHDVQWHADQPAPAADIAE